MTDTETIIDSHLSVLPFSGFYQTIHELFLELWIDCEDDCEDDCEGEPTGEETREYCVRYAQEYTKTFCKHFGITATFESLENNKSGIGERIFINIPLTESLRLWRAVKPDILTQTLKDLYTPRSGFIPHYEANLQQWIKQAGALKYWDHNEVYTLLLSYVTQNGFNSAIESELAEVVRETIV
jgi:hypothetical protein